MKSLTLKKDNEYEYILIKSTKEEVDELTELLKKKAKPTEKYPYLDELELCGAFKDISNGYVSEYIPIYKTGVFRPAPNSKAVYLTEYWCYANRTRHPFSTVVIHEDPTSSFRCACRCIGAEYFYIIKIKIELVETIGNATITN